MRIGYRASGATTALLGLTLLLTATVAGGETREWGAIEIANRSLEPGEKQKFSLAQRQNIEASYLDPPLWVAHGTRPGTRLCVTAAIHGDEMNGAEIARRVFAETDPSALSGTLVMMPVVNIAGFRTGSRYLPDRRDLNRSFPGNPNGSLAAFVAHAVFEQVISRCDALVDLHTGSLQRTNRPQIRVDLSHEASVEMALAFGAGVVIGGTGPKGSLRRAALEAGIPTILYEAGQPNSFQLRKIEPGVDGVQRVMAHLDLVEKAEPRQISTRVFTKTRWVRVPVLQGGFFFPEVDLSANVQEGDRLGRVMDVETDEAYEIRAPFPGKVIGMAIPQVVLSGYALFHLGTVEATEVAAAAGGR